jgi:predicted DNA-binding transcriptional regulator AlpA
MYLSIAQVAVRYGVATITIRRWWQAGYLPAPVQIGGSHRWSVAELEAFEASLKPAPSTERKPNVEVPCGG